MSRGGRPLRFLAVTLGGWTAARALLLWQAVVMTTGALLDGPTLSAAADLPADRLPLPAADRPPVAPWPARQAAAPTAPDAAPPARPARRDAPAAPRPQDGLKPAAAMPAEAGAIPPPLRPTPLATGRSRLAGSAWAIARGGSGGTLLGGQLGASQAGARLTYALGSGRRVALSARIASPLHGAGKEAALGLDWQPTRMPLHLLAEQRFSLDGQHGGPTLMLVGGLNPTPVAAGFRLEGYFQGGAIDRSGSGVEAFGDGSARLAHAVLTLGRARLDAGAGAWGAAQKGARRLDVGPTLGFKTHKKRKNEKFLK